MPRDLRPYPFITHRYDTDTDTDTDTGHTDANIDTRSDVCDTPGDPPSDGRCNCLPKRAREVFNKRHADLDGMLQV